MSVVPKIKLAILVPLNIRCRNTVYNQKGPLILRTTHVLFVQIFKNPSHATVKYRINVLQYTIHEEVDWSVQKM